VTTKEQMQQFITTDFKNNLAKREGSNEHEHEESIENTLLVSTETSWKDTIFVGKSCFLSHRAKEIDCPRDVIGQ
jgi:hypothetical protein